MPALSVYEEILDAVNAAATALSLSGIAAVVTEDEPQRTDRTLPYVSVCPAVQAENLPTGTNSRDDVTYAVQVAIIASKTSTTWQTVIGWRQSLRRRFSNQKLQSAALTGGTFVTMECRPGITLDPRAIATHKCYVSVLFVNVTVREARS